MLDLDDVKGRGCERTEINLQGWQLQLFVGMALFRTAKGRVGDFDGHCDPSRRRCQQVGPSLSNSNFLLNVSARQQDRGI
ncbi:hypothetical protein D3C71_1896840 [compost metagenome]